MFAWNLLLVAPLAAAVWLASRTPALRRRPAVVHLLWLLVLAKFVTPPLISMSVLPDSWLASATENLTKAEPASLSEGSRSLAPAIASHDASGAVSAEAVAPSLAEAVRATAAAADFTLNWHAIAWGALLASLTATLSVWAIAARRYVRTNRLLATQCVAEGRVADALRSVAQAMRMQRVPRLALVDEGKSPILWIGPRGGIVVLPREVVECLDEESLKLVLAHEVAHLVRRDGWSRLFAFFVKSLFWWHPVAWLARRELHDAAEASCDALAISRLQGSRRRYAEALLELADASVREFRWSPVAAAIPFGEVRTLTKRIALVAEGGVQAEASRVGVAIAILLAAGLFVVPTRADESAAPAAEQQVTAEEKPASEQPVVEAAPAVDGKLAADEVAGRVVDGTGQPLEGVLVDLWTWYPGNEMTTGADGKFRMKSKQPREKAQMRFSKEEFSPYYIENVPQGGDPLTIMLDNKTYLEGTVRGPNGEVAKRATIRADHPALNEYGQETGVVPTTTTTDEQGRYRLLLHPQTYELQVVVPGVGATRLPGVVVSSGEGKSLDIQLKPAVRFEAMVVDAETKQPYAGLILWDWKDRSVMGVSDEAGRIVIEGMLPGPYEFNVGQGELIKSHGVTFYQHGQLGRWWSPDGTTQWSKKQTGTDGWQHNVDELSFNLAVGMKPVTIEVERGVTFSGHVYDPDGKPVAGATVAPAKTGSGNSLTGDTRYSVRTEADGSYRVVMPAGHDFKYNLIAHDGDYEEWRNWANGVSETFATKPGDVMNDIDLKLTRPATVRGRVIAPAGASAAGKQVRAAAADGKENRYYDPTTEVRAGDGGEFELKFIRPGRHDIQVEPFSSGMGVTVELKEGETLEGVELTLPPARQFIPAAGASAIGDFQLQE